MNKQKLAVAGAVTAHVYSFNAIQCYAVKKRHCVCVCVCVLSLVIQAKKWWMGPVGVSQHSAKHCEKKKENEGTAVTDARSYAAKAACSQSQCSRDSHRAAT